MAASPLPFQASFPERSTLTQRDRVVLRAMAEAMFSQDGEVERTRIDAHLDEVDSYISAASRPVRFGLRIALFVVRIAPLLLFFSVRTIDRLSVDERVDVLTRLERSSIINLSLAFIGWRTVMTLVFYEDAAELKAIGYASDERKVYKRRLSLVSIGQPPASVPSLAVSVPAAEDSGVRLRNPDSEHPAAADAEDSGEHKVA